MGSPLKNDRPPPPPSSHGEVVPRLIGDQAQGDLPVAAVASKQVPAMLHDSEWIIIMIMDEYG
jgi:hypothetical protein